jgi:immune inhibitor A
MMLSTCRCGIDGDHDAYRHGPTTCVANREVLESIRTQISASGVLSTADARLATLSGMLDIPSVGRTGFNDAVIYEPGSGATGPALASAATRSPSKQLSLAPPSGKTTLNCLVLLVDFSDNVGALTSAHFQRLLFDPSNPNSMHSFYKEMSYGRLNVIGQVTNWMRASRPYTHYTAGESGTGNAFPRNTPGLLQEMLQQYCTANSLAPFDVNGDGHVDGLFLIHAGGGAEAEPNQALRRDMIWSHKWTLPTSFINSGVRAFAYFTAPEDGKLGVFAHEFGHFLGLPDLYDTSYRSEGIGDWCLMAGGSWNGNGNQPARMSAWCLQRLGWIKPTNITGPKSLTLDTLAKAKTESYRLWTKGKASKEYFLIENRQKTGRDAKLPGHGLAVWHIDETQSDNTNPFAYRVALVQADGKRHLELAKNQGDSGDVFPGSKGVTRLNDAGATHPHTRKNDGTATGVSLTNIKEAGGIVTLNVKV